MRTIILFLFAALAVVSSSVHAQQLPGHPNTGTQTVSSYVSNSLFPYENQTGGVIEIQSGGWLDNMALASLENHGVLHNLSGGTLTNDGHIINENVGDFQNSGVVYSNDHFVNNGTLANEPGGSINNESGFYNNGTGTLRNNGVINHGYSPPPGVTYNTMENYGVIINDQNGILRNKKKFANYGTLENHSTLDNEGLMDIAWSGGIVHNYSLFNSKELRIIGGGSLNNAGTLVTTYRLDNSNILDNSDTLINVAGGELRNFATLNNSGTLTNDGFLKNQRANVNAPIAIINNTGALISNGSLNNNDTVNNSGTLTNNGTLDNNSGSGSPAFLNNSGTLTNNGTLNNHDLVRNTGQLINHGLWINHPESRLENFGAGQFINDEGGVLRNNGVIDIGDGTFLNYGAVEGTGTIRGGFYDTGVIRPGNSAGVVKIEGDYFKQGGSNEIELGGIFNGGGDHTLTEFDWLDVTGNVELAGVLDVYLIDSFEILAGMSFDILKVGGTLTGQYDGLDEGKRVGTFSGINLYITYAGGEGSSVTLFSRAVPEPAALLLALLGLALVPRRRRRSV